MSGDLQSFNDFYAKGDAIRAIGVLADAALGKSGSLRTKFDQAIQDRDLRKALALLAKAIYNDGDKALEIFDHYFSTGQYLQSLNTLAGSQFKSEIDERSRRLNEMFVLLGHRAA